MQEEEYELITDSQLVEFPVDLRAMEPGVYDIPNEHYHASNGISRSAISELKISPLHYWDKYINPKRPPKKKTPAMTLGSVVNTLILEPVLFDEQFLVVKKINGATKEGKSYKKEIEAIIGKRTAIYEETFEKAWMMVDHVMKHNKAMRILDGACVEKSLYWIDPDTKMLCKTRPDIWNRDLRILADLKTSRGPTPYEFAYEAEQGDYHIQAAMQIDGIKNQENEWQQEIEDFCFVVMPNERPFVPYIYHMPAAMIDRGRREYKYALHVAKKCYQTQNWYAEREIILPMQYGNFQLTKNSFLPIKEIYDVRISY